jgi:hypothetical protein
MKLSEFINRLEDFKEEYGDSNLVFLAGLPFGNTEVLDFDELRKSDDPLGSCEVWLEE